MKKLPLLLIFFVWASHSRADNVLEIKNPQQGVYEVDPRIQIHNLSQVTMALADSGSLLSAQEIASGKFDSLFQPLEKVYPLKANTTYWLKLALVYAAPVKDWWLMISDKDSTLVHYSNHLKTVFYLTDSSGKIISEQKSGVTVPRSQKSIKEIPSVSRALISATGGDRQKIYISIYNSMDFGFGKYPFIELRNPVTGLTTHFFEVLLSMLSSTAFTFFLLSFFFFFFIRDKAYLFFSIYALVLSLHYLILHPQIVFITWFIPEHPQWVLPLWTMLSMSSFIFFFLFGRSFVNLRHLSPITDRLLKIYLLLLSIYILASAALLAIKEKEFVSSPILFMIMFIALAFIVRIAFFRNTLSRFFVVGALWLLTFTVLGIMKNLNIGSIPFNPWPVGQLGQLLIYSLGLAFKIRINEQAKAEADRIKDLDSIKSKFFSNISHEFRTPLTLIQGPLQQIADAAPATGTVTVPARQVHLMKRNADRLLELVNQLLDLSRLDSGKMKLQVIKGDVMQLLKTIAYSFESLAERKQIHYHIQFPDATLISYYDKDKLEKIVTNLLGNAFKYTPEQGRVSLNIEADEKKLRISIDDSGKGIPKKELDKIFDRFYQVEGNEDKGTGIGLAFVNELVDLYRGQISVSSEPGKGSRFKVSLPLSREAFKEDEIYQRVSGEETSITVNPAVFLSENDGDPAITSKIKSPDLPLVLIVEDNADLRIYIRECLEEQYELMEAENGKQGFVKAVEQIPDLIVSDVMMPEMDGFAMTEKLKKDERTSHIPIILLTAKAGQDHKIAGLQTGADDYLTKPFDAKEIRIRILNLVNQRKLLRKKFAGQIVVKPNEVTVNSTDEIFLSKVMAAIEKNMADETFGVEQLADAVAMSRSQLHRKLTALLDQSPSIMIRNARLLRAKELLQKRAGSASEIAYRVGFNSHTYFSKCFKEEFGVSPGELNQL